MSQTRNTSRRPYAAENIGSRAFGMTAEEIAAYGAKRALRETNHFSAYFEDGEWHPVYHGNHHAESRFQTLLDGTKVLPEDLADWQDRPSDFKKVLPHEA